MAGKYSLTFSKATVQCVVTVWVLLLVY